MKDMKRTNQTFRSTNYYDWDDKNLGKIKDRIDNKEKIRELQDKAKRKIKWKEEQN